MAGRDQDYQSRIEKSAATFLHRWNGGSARLLELSASHPCLTIRVTSADEARRGWYLDILCIEPNWIQGPRLWEDCQIAIQGKRELRSGEEGFRVADERVGLEVETTSIEVKECQWKKAPG